MIILLGTSHISPESIKQIRKTIEKEKPDCVAVELDRMRFISMISKKREGRRPPGIFLKLLSLIQKELGKMTGISPGDEMMEAVKISREKNIKTYLIDQDFSITVGDIRKVSAVEKIKLFFMTLFSGVSHKKIDLNKVPPKEMVQEAIKYLETNFPQMHEALVKKRNIHMQKALLGLSKEHEKILAVVGAGHIEGLKKLLKNEKTKIIR